MRDTTISQIKARLSLRPPQADCLDILADVIDKSALCNLVPFSRGVDPANLLDTVRDNYPSVLSFERDFPSLCFSLATGVGKTRLIGAFISWLFLTGRSRHFFVLAPNTTIYNKLVTDFTPGKDKYVLTGLADFVQSPPLIVTGDNWDDGHNITSDTLFRNAAEINIFNVDKINKEQGRIKTLNEYIGQSYFEYLASLPDLVLLMDEAHRYRAKAGLRAISELKPVLGLELTATPRTVGSHSERFKNVIYEYTLAEAMRDGFVKEPAVATRKDFDPKSVSPEQLELIKLEDGIHCHENVKAELDIYARTWLVPVVHPFMLIVAQDTTHAEALRKIIESEEFFGGRYKGRVIRVDSNIRGEESEDTTARLLSLETNTATDIVIHVNMLKEGWDVRNLYTIVPLRASASEILTEQTLGRGLRLPYGARTGVEAVDTLTVIAHDRFDDLIRAARDPRSIVSLKAVMIGAGGDVSAAGATILESPSFAEAAVSGITLQGQSTSAPLFKTLAERRVAELSLSVIREHFEQRCKGGISLLIGREMQEQLVWEVDAAMSTFSSPQEPFRPGQEELDVAEIVSIVTKSLNDMTISIPEIVILPTRDVTFGFSDFNLVGLDAVAMQPMSDDIMIQHLRDEARIFLSREPNHALEEIPENYLVRHLIDFPEVDYDSHSELLFKLSNQIVARLRSYLRNEGDVINVLLAHGRELSRFIFLQMKQHQWETPTDFQAHVSRGFTLLRPQLFNVNVSQLIRDFRTPVVPTGDTRKQVFGGFRRSCFPYQRFDSNEEREFAVLIDGPKEPNVKRWMKPGPGQFRIEYANGHGYEPDFVVETDTGKFIVEIKARSLLGDPIVASKTKAAVEWVKHANSLLSNVANVDKRWTYALIPHDSLSENATFAGLVAQYARSI